MTAFFSAVEASDCAGALKWLDGAAKERFEREPCQESLEALRRKRFQRVLSSQVDGRDERMRLVRVAFAEERAPAVIGVRKTRKGHRIVSF